MASIADLGLAYLHIMEAPGQRELTTALRGQWTGALILNPDAFPQPTGPDELALLRDGTADLFSFGGLFLANPDLPARLAARGPFNTHTGPDRAGFFGGDHRGYTDYPTLPKTPAPGGGAAQRLPPRGVASTVISLLWRTRS